MRRSRRTRPDSEVPQRPVLPAGASELLPHAGSDGTGQQTSKSLLIFSRQFQDYGTARLFVVVTPYDLDGRIVRHVVGIGSRHAFGNGHPQRGEVLRPIGRAARRRPCGRSWAGSGADASSRRPPRSTPTPARCNRVCRWRAETRRRREVPAARAHVATHAVPPCCPHRAPVRRLLSAARRAAPNGPETPRAACAARSYRPPRRRTRRRPSLRRFPHGRRSRPRRAPSPPRWHRSSPPPP